jgi:CubicO group peptidase (beta-lactamase class C family)
VGPDRVLLVPTRFGLGYFLPAPFSPMAGPASFGHAGAGGSLGFADPETGVAFGYVMNKMQQNLAADARTLTLIEAVTASI